MIYFDKQTDAYLEKEIESLLAKQYFTEVEESSMFLEPYDVYRVKAEKVEIPNCTQEQFHNPAVSGAFIHRGTLITNAGVKDGVYDVIFRKNPDARLINYMMRLLYYLSLGDTVNVYGLIENISIEKKNVISQNTMSIKRQETANVKVKPWQL